MSRTDIRDVIMILKNRLIYRDEREDREEASNEESDEEMRVITKEDRNEESDNERRYEHEEIRYIASSVADIKGSLRLYGTMLPLE